MNIFNEVLYYTNLSNIAIISISYTDKSRVLFGAQFKNVSGNRTYNIFKKQTRQRSGSEE